MELKAPLESITSVIFTWFSYQGIFFVPLLLPEQLFSLLNPTGRYIISVVQWNLVLFSFLFLGWSVVTCRTVCFGDLGPFSSVYRSFICFLGGVIWWSPLSGCYGCNVLISQLCAWHLHPPGHQNSTSFFYCSSQYSESDLIHTDI